MKEYKIAKGWAIFIYLFAPLMIGVFGWLLILPFQNGNFSPNASWILIPISLAMIALIIFGLIDTYKGRLIIQEDRITSVSAFSNRVLKFNQIKGYTVNDYYIFIDPKIKGKKRIKISKYTGGYGEILIWLSLRFSNLGEQEIIEEEQKLLNDEDFDWTKEIREKKLSKARQISKIINWTAGITAACLLFYPRPFHYQYSFLIAIILPIVALLVMKFSNGLIRMDEKTGSAYTSVMYAFAFPSIVLMLRAFFDYAIFDYSNLWLPAIIITISFLFLLLIKQRDFTFKKKLHFFIVSMLALMSFAYSFGTVLHINCYYDNSQPQYFKAKVLDKRISSGRRSTSYYLELAPWGPQKEIDEVSVGKGLYKRIVVGDDVKIYFRNGKLGIPWYIIIEK